MRVKFYLLVSLLLTLTVWAHAQQNRLASDCFRVLDEEKCDGSIEIELIRHWNGHKWGHNKTLYLQFKNQSGNWEDLASIQHEFTDHNTYLARQVGSYSIGFENRNPGMEYDYYSYKITVRKAPNPNNRVAYRWIQKENNDYLSDTKYITAYRPKAVNIQAENSTGCGHVRLSWEKPLNVDGSVDYLIYRRTKGHSSWSYKNRQTSRVYVDNSAGNTIYEYKVVAYLSCGNRGFDSDPVEGHGILPIDAPEFFEAESECDNKVRLTWRKPLRTPASYQIQVANNTSFNNAQVYDINNGNIVEKEIELSEPFVNNYFRIRSNNECDSFGRWSERAEAMAYNLPDVPTNFTSSLVVDDNSFKFTWDDVANEENFIIRRVNKEDATEIVDFIIDENQTAFIDNTVNFCTPYKYTLFSYRECGEVRGESFELTLTPDLSNYLASLDISKGYYSDRIELAWEVPSNRKVSEVRIYRSRKGETNKELVASLESRQRSWTDYKSDANVLYDYQVIGIQLCGEEDVETNLLTGVGFRMPFGTVYGNVSFEGGNPVPDAEVIAEPIDDNGLIGNSAEFNGTARIEVEHRESFSTLSELTVQMFIKPDVTTSSDDQIVTACIDEAANKGFSLAYNSAEDKLKVTIGDGSSFQILESIANLTSDAFSYVALCVSASSVKLFVNKIEVGTLAISSVIQMPKSKLKIGGMNDKNGFIGLLDEFAFYSKAKTVEQIAIDYNRKLSAGESNLLVYFQMDEGVGSYAYDSSKTGRDYNKSHGQFQGATWSSVIPSASQLSYKGMTDDDGNYTLSFIKYSGRGQVFNITPIKNIHQFLPSQKRQFLGEGTEYVSIDFKDVSSFRVTGSVVYTLDDSNYPAKEIRLLIDGQIVTNKGRVVETNVNGEFDIQVPIGEHIISVQKENHVFKNSTFPASGELHDFRENITGIQFKDETSVLVAGRVVGGRIEGDRIIGFGLSQNNIGMATISFQSEQDDRYRKQVETDVNTGEYEVELLPINTLVTGVSVSNPDVIFKPESYSDILKLDQELIKKEEKKQVFEDQARTILESEEIYEYNYKKNFIYRASPSLALYNEDDELFDGELSMNVIVNRQTNETAVVDVSNKKLGFPVLFSDKLYNLKIKAFEKYTNPNVSPVVTSFVPVTDGKISIVNNLGDSEQISNDGDTENLELNNQNGEIEYKFVSKKPTLLSNTEHPEFSFTETFKITLEAGGNVTEWKPDNNFFRAYLVGSKTKGKGFVTTGPETVKWVLHDPPGSNSCTYIESGTTFSTTSEMTFHQDLTNNLNTTVNVGPEIVIGGGILGPQVKTETKSQLSFDFNVSQSAGRNDIDVTSVTFNNKMQTSADPNQVGDASDLFIGYANNILYGEAEAFSMIPVSQIEAGNYDAIGSVVDINGANYQLAKSPSFYINTNGFNTMFVYSKAHIEDVVVPELKDLRNSLFTKTDKAYVSKLIPTHDRYGINNDDVLWQSSASTEDPLVTDVEDYDGSSYTYKHTEHEGEIDSIRWYNQQIRLWTESLARSEREKVESTKFFNESSSNISFVGGGQSFEGSKTVVKTTSVVETWDLAFETGFAATFGAKINKAGVLNTNVFAIKMGGGGNYTTENTEMNNYGYILTDGDVGDSFTVDILDPESGSSPVFRLRAGRSACPFEGPEATRYYQPGTIFNQGTQQRERANLEVASSSIVDNIPAHEPAIFTLNLGNASETGDASWYGLRVVEGSNPHGAAIKLNGGILSTPLEIQGGTTAQVQVSLGKNPKYDDYDDVKIMMYSTCEFENYMNYGAALVTDTVTLSAYFIPSCGDIAITQPQNNWVINTESNNQTEIVVEGLGTIEENFKSLFIQYRPEGKTNWINLQKYVSNPTLVEEGTVLIPGGTKTIKYVWNSEQVNEGTYELRLLSTCKSDVQNESLPLLGTIDRECPGIFGSVSPEDGVLNAGEVIRFSFNEDLRKELVSKQNIKVRGVLNGGELTHSVAAFFDGLDNNMLIRTNGQTSTGSFTIEFWAKRTGSGKQIVYAQASNSNKVFEIGFDRDNKLTLQVANEILVVPQPVEENKWFHWAFSFDCESKLLSIFKNDQDVARKILTQDITRVGDIRIGKASDGTAYPFSGSMHELRIWNKTLTRSQIASKMSARLSGNEIDLQGLWRMDEGAADICIDEVRSRNAVFNADWEISPKGKSAYFDGASAMKVKSDKFAFGDEDDFTISFWFYTSATSAQTLFSNGDALDSQDPHEWNIAMNASGNIVTTNSGIEYVIGSKTFNDGNWHHIAMVVKNPGATNFIIDGNTESSISSIDVGGLAGSYYLLGASGGANGSGESITSSYFTGNIDEFRIWSYARSQKMIVRDMRFKMDAEELGLVAYIPLEKYIVKQNTASLQASFEEQSENHAEETHRGVSLDINVPNIKLPRTVENVNFALLKTDRDIIVQLDEELSRIERCNLDISLFDVLDLQNNKMRNPYTHCIKIDQNQLRWETPSTKQEFPEHDGGEFVVEIANTGIKAQSFSIHNLPSWIELRPQAGTIEGGQSQEIRMIVHQGLNVGYYHEQIYLRGDDLYNEPLFMDIAIQASKPKWSQDLGNFQYNMNVIGRLIIDDIPSTDENDMIAAYVGNELRGFAKVMYQQAYDNYAVYLSIGSDQTFDEIVKFKIWDASTGLVYPVDDIQYEFESDVIKGSVAQPIEFRSGDLIQRDINLEAGWNWISINLRNTNDQVNTVFENIGAANGDRLVGQTGFYQYDNDQWTGSTDLISFTKMYKLYVIEAANLRISGIPVDPVTTEIPLSSGWNWVSYTPQFNAEINEALSLYQAKDNDEIKTMNRFARYDLQTKKWYGSLTHLVPGEGYQIKTSEESKLYYPENSSFRNVKSTKAGAVSEPAEEDEKSILMIDAKRNMSVVAKLEDELGRAVKSEKVTAFINDEAVSITKKMDGPNGDDNLFYITVPSKEYFNEICFKYETIDGEINEVKSKLRFNEDATLGSMRNPEILLVGALANNANKLNIVPNPVKLKFKALILLEEQSNVLIEIYSLSGQKLYSSDLGIQDLGSHEINLNHVVGDLKSGTYLIVIKLDKEIIRSKFVKL